MGKEKSETFKRVSVLSNLKQDRKKKVTQKEALDIIHPLELDAQITITDNIWTYSHADWGMKLFPVASNFFPSVMTNEPL